jgi:hypothetical protein
MAKLGVHIVIVLNWILLKYGMKEGLQLSGSEEGFCENGNESIVTVTSDELVSNIDRQRTASWK